MIIKKIKNPSKSASKATRVNGLANYIAAPEKSNVNEKCVYQGSQGFLTESFEAQKAEMLALAQEAVRSRDPINHYVMSWKENEQPSPAQVEEAVGIFLKEMGLAGHQALYGLHADTANLHLHVMVNRVHPDSLKVIKPNNGFDIEAAHRAIARIEHVQGWERERHGRYQVLDTGEVERGQREQQRAQERAHGRRHDLAHEDVDRLRQPEQAKRDMEERTGEKSAERIAIEEAAPILREATSWLDVHRRLAENGMRYEKVGSGAVVFVGDVGVKASRTDRAASLTKMEKRLGKFVPADGAPDPGVPLNTARKADTSIVPLQSPRPLAKGVAGWPDYIHGRRAHYAAKTIAVEDQKRRHLLERREFSDAQKTARQTILVNGFDAGKPSIPGVWKGRGELRQAMQSVLAAEQAGERADLKERHQGERALLRERFAPYPDFEVWLRERGQSELAERWRYRDRSGRNQDVEREDERPREREGVLESERGRELKSERRVTGSRDEIARISGAGSANENEHRVSVAHPPRDIRNYVAHIRGREVHYSRRVVANNSAHSADSTSRRAPQVAFIDKGREIEVRDWRNDDSLLAALQLSAQKWGALSVTGSDDYKARCAALAVEHGFKIVNPELQEHIRQGIQAKQAIGRNGERVMPKAGTPLEKSSPGSLVDIYRRHYEDIVQGQARRDGTGEGCVDPSRVDAMIAVRMRMTGHDQVAIKQALQQCSPGAHGRSAAHGRDWDHYAERTAQYAFGPAGTRRAEQLSPHRAKWEKLEGRERPVRDVDQSRGVASREKLVQEQEHPKPVKRKGPQMRR